MVVNYIYLQEIMDKNQEVVFQNLLVHLVIDHYKMVIIFQDDHIVLVVYYINLFNYILMENLIFRIMFLLLLYFSILKAIRNFSLFNWRTLQITKILLRWLLITLWITFFIIWSIWSSHNNLNYQLAINVILLYSYKTIYIKLSNKYFN